MIRTISISESQLHYIIKESIDDAIDAEYMDAVKTGDIEKVRSMVLMTATKAMPNTKVVDSDGSPMVVFHGTKNKFNTFKRGDVGFHFGTLEQANMVNNKRIIIAYLNIENPLVINYDPEEWDYNGNFIYDLKRKGIIKKDEFDNIFMNTNSEYRNFTRVRNALKEIGYDGIIYPNWFEFKGGNEYRTEFDNSYIALYPSQIKSAEPITYDESGNIIPLSKRFDMNNKDIRY